MLQYIITGCACLAVMFGAPVGMILLMAEVEADRQKRSGRTNRPSGGLLVPAAA